MYVGAVAGATRAVCPSGRFNLALVMLQPDSFDKADATKVNEARKANSIGNERQGEEGTEVERSGGGACQNGGFHDRVL